MISNCCFAAGMLDGHGWGRGSSNRVVIASCREQQMMVLPDASRLTARVLDTVFPIDGAGRRRRAVDYAALEAQVASMASVSQTPTVVALDLRRHAFVPQPLVPLTS